MQHCRPRYFRASLHDPPPSRLRFFKVSTCVRIQCNRSKYSSRVAWPITGSSFWPPVDTAGHRAGSNQRPVFTVQCVDGGRVLGVRVTRPPAAHHMACTRFSENNVKDTYYAVYCVLNTLKVNKRGGGETTL